MPYLKTRPHVICCYIDVVCFLCGRSWYNGTEKWVYRNILGRHGMALLLGLTVLALSGGLAGADTTTVENQADRAVTPLSDWDADLAPDSVQVIENCHNDRYPCGSEHFNTERKRVSVSRDDAYSTGLERWSNAHVV